MKILAVDANSELLEVYKALFNEANVDVCTCLSIENSKEKISEFQKCQQNVDLVLTDLHISASLDGLEFVREMKELSPSIAFIFVSYSDYLKRQLNEEFGDCYINKHDFIDLLSETMKSNEPIDMNCFMSFFKRSPRLIFD